MPTAIVSDEKRIRAAAEEIFDNVKGSLPEILLEEIPMLLFVGEESIAIDFMEPYYKDSNDKLSQGLLGAIEELYELKL